MSPIRITEVIRYLFNKTSLHKLSIHLDGVRVLFFQTPSVGHVTFKTISDNMSTGHTVRTVSNCMGDKNSLPGIYSKISSDELKETTISPEFIAENGVRKFRDVSGACLNIQNGIRNTLPHPNDSHDGTIYIFGGTPVFGFGVRDDQTIASCLQQIFPSKKVLNCSNFLEYFSWRFMLPLLLSMQFTQGDIVLINTTRYMGSVESMHWLNIEDVADPFMKIDLSSFANDPEREDLFLLPYGLAPWGNKKVAELLRDEICRLEWA